MASPGVEENGMHASSSPALPGPADPEPGPGNRRPLVLGIAAWTLGTAAALGAYSTIVLHGQEPAEGLAATGWHTAAPR